MGDKKGLKELEGELKEESEKRKEHKSEERRSSEKLPSIPETPEEEMLPNIEGAEAGPPAGERKRRHALTGCTSLRGPRPGTSKASDAAAESAAWEKLENTIYKKALSRLSKIPKWILCRDTSQRRYRFLPPKDAIQTIQNLRPGCEFDVTMESADPLLFIAQVTHNDYIIGEGHGGTRGSAMEAAAEDAVRNSVMRFFCDNSDRQDSPEREEESSDSDEPEDHLSWNALASYAMHEVFREWEEEGMRLPPIPFEDIRPSGRRTRSKARELPPNAGEINPCVLLKTLRPEAKLFDIEKIFGCRADRAVIAYGVDGEIFTGKGANVKEAKQEAAKAVLSRLFGIRYD